MSTNPQLEDGYTRIVNVILEELAMRDIAPGAMSILIIVMRQTWGFRKKLDRISISQFMEKTGLSKTGTINAIKTLVDNKMIYKIGRKHAPSYAVQKDYTLWLCQNRHGQVQKQNGQVCFTENGQVCLTHKRNKESTKEKKRDFQSLLRRTTERMVP